MNVDIFDTKLVKCHFKVGIKRKRKKSALKYLEQKVKPFFTNAMQSNKERKGGNLTAIYIPICSKNWLNSTNFFFLTIFLLKVKTAYFSM